MSKTKSPRALVADFFDRITLSKHDSCLTFKAAEHHDILAKRMQVHAIADDLKQPIQMSAKFGFCLGIEDYPEDDLPKVLENVLTAARRCYFYIEARQRPIWWWLKQFHKVDGTKILFAEQENFGYKIFATRYTLRQDLEDYATINVGEDVIERNIKANLAYGCKEIVPCIEQDAEIVFCLGGPSLNDFADDIYAKAHSGIPVVTANGAYNWCIEHKILPAAQIVLDGRKFNKRFVEPYLANCKYLLCSQCDPDLVASLPTESVTLWHPFKSDTFNVYVREYKEQHPEVIQEWFPIGGGGTVALRGFALLITLGFRKFHVYGFDSCLRGDQHHAFNQPEDDTQHLMYVAYGGRTFKCFPWMISQANEFMQMTKHMIGQFCQMEIYGDGLIAHAIRTLAEGEHNGGNQMDVLRPGEGEPAQRYDGPRYPRYEDGVVEE